MSCTHDKREGTDECYGCWASRNQARMYVQEAVALIDHARKILEDDDVNLEAADSLARISSDLGPVTRI
jgi:hypothetical protein